MGFLLEGRVSRGDCDGLTRCKQEGERGVSPQVSAETCSFSAGVLQVPCPTQDSQSLQGGPVNLPEAF